MGHPSASSRSALRAALPRRHAGTRPEGPCLMLSHRPLCARMVSSSGKPNASAFAHVSAPWRYRAGMLIPSSWEILIRPAMPKPLSPWHAPVPPRPMALCRGRNGLSRCAMPCWRASLRLAGHPQMAAHLHEHGHRDPASGRSTLRKITPCRKTGPRNGPCQGLHCHSPGIRC
jgi:hypothetical protein